MGEWNHGLCGCFDNLGSCIISYFVPCYAVGKAAEAAGDSCLVCGILVATPAAIVTVPMVRSKIREHQGIDGNFVMDFLYSCFCFCCVVSQMYQEATHINPGAMAIERE